MFAFGTESFKDQGEVCYDICGGTLGTVSVCDTILYSMCGYSCVVALMHATNWILHGLLSHHTFTRYQHTLHDWKDDTSHVCET